MLVKELDKVMPRPSKTYSFFDDGFCDSRERARRDYRDLLERNRILARKLKLTVEQSSAYIKKLEKRIQVLESERLLDD